MTLTRLLRLRPAWSCECAAQHWTPQSAASRSSCADKMRPPLPLFSSSHRPSSADSTTTASSQRISTNASAWASTGRWMAATSGFGVGVHHPHVRHVFFLGGAHSIVSFWQAAGRGGRDGLPYNVVVFTYASRHTATTEVADWLDQDGCRISSLGEQIDGTAGVPCYLTSQQPCDRCEPLGTNSFVT